MPRRGGSDNGSENPELVGTFETLRDEGEHFVHVKQWQKAIDSFTRAIDMNPEDKKCYVTRSKCWLQLGNAENALIDSEEALKQDKEYIPALLQKSEAMYQLGDFETALVYFHRGHKLRPEYQEFRLGIQKAQEAINNSIGQPDSVKLTAEGDLTYFYKQEELFPTAKKAKGKKTGGTYGKPGAKKEAAKERQRPQGSGDQKTIKQLLGELYGDKDFLEKLLTEDSLTSDSNPTNKGIREKIYDGLEYLHNRADFWRQQKPMYARKRDKMKQRQSAKARNQDPTNYLLRCLEDIDDDQTKERYEESLQKAKKTLKTVENMSDDQLQNKAEILANLHSQIGNAHLELGKYNESLKHHEEDLKIAKENDLEDARSRALDNLGRVHARKGNYEKAIGVWEEKLPLSKSPLESTWLYHEIGRCYLELQRYQDSRDFGEKAIQAAKEAEDDGWQLHASVLVAQSEVKLNDLQSAAESFERSLELAKKLNDGPAEAAIKKAMEEVNNRIVQGVKEGDEKDEDDKGSVKSEGGRKGATSQTSVKGNEKDQDEKRSRHSKEDGDQDGRDEDYPEDFEQDQQDNGSKRGSNSQPGQISKKDSTDSKPDEIPNTLTSDNGSNQESNSQPEQTSKKESTDSKPDENPNTNTEDKDNEPRETASPKQPQSPSKVKPSTSPQSPTKSNPTASKKKESKKGPDSRRVSKELQKSTKNSPGQKGEAQRKTSKSSPKGKASPPAKKTSNQEKTESTEKEPMDEHSKRNEVDDENDEIRKVSEANSEVNLFENEEEKKDNSDAKLTSKPKKKSSVEVPPRKKSSPSPYEQNSKKKTSTTSTKSKKNSVSSNEKSEEIPKQETDGIEEKSKVDSKEELPLDSRDKKQAEELPEQGKSDESVDEMKDKSQTEQKTEPKGSNSEGNIMPSQDAIDFKLPTTTRSSPRPPGSGVSLQPRTNSRPRSVSIREPPESEKGSKGAHEETGSNGTGHLSASIRKKTPSPVVRKETPGVNGNGTTQSPAGSAKSKAASEPGNSEETNVQMISDEDSAVPLETEEKDTNVEVEPYDTEASEKGLGYSHPFEIKQKENKETTEKEKEEAAKS